MEQFMAWFIPILSIVVTALTTLATWNLRISSANLKKLTETVEKIQQEIVEHSVRIEYLEKELDKKGGDRCG